MLFKSRFAIKSTIAKCTTVLTFERVYLQYLNSVERVYLQYLNSVERVYLQYLNSVERVEVQGGGDPWDALSHTSLPAN